MLLDINHHSGVPIYRQVIEQIQRQIMAGQLKKGQQLPSVRELAEQLRVNPMTISKAYALLELEGLVERRRGIGLFAARIRKDHETRTKGKLLEDILRRAAIAAVQFGIPEEKARDMLVDLYRKYNSKSRSYFNE